MKIKAVKLYLCLFMPHTKEKYSGVRYSCIQALVPNFKFLIVFNFFFKHSMSVKLTTILGLMQFRIHGAYITSVTDMTTYDILFYSMTKCILKHTQTINYSTFNINKTWLLYTVQCKTEMLLR